MVLSLSSLTVPKLSCERASQPVMKPRTYSLIRGLNNYLYYFGSSLLYFLYNGPQNPVLIIKAPISGFLGLQLFNADGSTRIGPKPEV